METAWNPLALEVLNAPQYSKWILENLLATERKDNKQLTVLF